MLNPIIAVFGALHADLFLFILSSIKERVTKSVMENYLKMDMVKCGKITRATVINCITGPEGSGNKLMFNFRVEKGERPKKRAKIPEESDSGSDLELQRENDESYSTEQTLKLGGTSSSKGSSTSSSK